MAEKETSPGVECTSSGLQLEPEEYLHSPVRMSEGIQDVFHWPGHVVNDTKAESEAKIVLFSRRRARR
eukprot:11155533-Lingulodinium_polyedra.AAC.1